MKRKLLLFCLFVATYTSAQYIESTPWMENLKKGKGLTNKSESVNFSIDEIRGAFDEYWKNSGRDPKAKGSGYKQFKRWENYWKYMVDANGMLPTSAQLWDSYQNKINGAIVPNPVSDWEPIGPNRPGTLGGALPGTGRINTIEVDPNNPDIWYAGAPAGGIWRSDDAGLNWTNLFDEFLQVGVSGIAIDPNNSNIIYIATGDDDRADSFSIGVFKSLDGGQTWNQTGLTPVSGTTNVLMNEIFIDPTNSNIVWVGTNAGLFKSEDGGDTFDNVLQENVGDFRLKPGDPNTVYAVSRSQYFKTTDGGANFIQISDALPAQSGRLMMAVTPADPNVLYIASADTSANNFGYQGIFRSSDSGETFTESPNTVDIYESNQAFFDFTIEASPTNADEVYVGVLNIWRSVDGADSFTRLNQWFQETPSYTHADIHTLRFFGDRLFACTDGGLYFSDDRGATFTDQTGNMEVTQFYRISIADNDTSRIAGGTQDNSGFVFNNGNWNVYTGGDGMDYEIDPNNPNLIYGFSQFGGVLFVTTNTGQSVDFVGAPRNSSGDAIEGNWITPLAVGNDGNVYSGYSAVYRLEPNGWQQISANFNGNIEDLEVAPSNPQILYAAEGQSIFRSNDGGVTFEEIAELNSLISSFAINENDPNILYVATSDRVGIPQFAQPDLRGVFRVTYDAVTSLGNIEDITLNLPTDQAYFSIAHQGRHTDNPIFVGTYLGVYRLDDTLTEWEEYFTGLPNVAIGDLEIDPLNGIMVASTYGLGAWQSPIPLQITENEVELISVSPIDGSVNCGGIIPQIEVRNGGTASINQVEVTFSINNGALQNFVWNGTIESGNTTSIPLPPINDTPVGELISLNVDIIIPNDTFIDNNSGSSQFYRNEFGIASDINTFEETDQELISYNIDSFSETVLFDTPSLWERGVPSGTLLNEASSGTQVYGTNLDGNHPDNVKSALVSKCYELASITAPVLRFNMAFDLEINFDIVYVEYSTDNGSSWNILGNINSQPNWYNSDRTNANSGAANDCQNCPGAQWTGDGTTLTEYAYDFVANAASGETDLTGEQNITFRIVFESDFAVNEEGVIVDDFVVEGTQIDDDDDDNDGILDVDDNCPLIANQGQLDTDGDGLGDVCDDDDDGDGILDMEDNCPLVSNADQADVDGDGIGDLCDNDDDNDGVMDDVDLCPDTPAGAVVDVDGCEVFSLSPTNFNILTIGESCINNDNGMIQITAETNLVYTASLQGVGNDVMIAQDFTESTEFNDLSAGTYTLCLTVMGDDQYEFCSDVIIVQPQPLSVNSRISTLNNEVTLNLSGGTNYTITLNGVAFNTTESELTLQLPKVRNTLQIRTDKDCQGLHSETIFINPKTIIYPNPISSGDLTILLDNDAPVSVVLSLYTVEGAQLFNKELPVENQQVSLNMDAFTAGIYILNINTEGNLTNYKIVKR